ncbi:MAG: ABC transporter ATP-binding protein [Gammaproteobacteria bacterium]
MDRPAAPLLEVRGVSKHFGGIAALDGLSLTLEEAELKCVIGPNGCGKTTLFNVVTGAFAPGAGEVRFCGNDITGHSPHRIGRLGVSRKFQVPGIYPSLSVVENLEVALVRSSASGNPFGLLRGRSSTATLGEMLRRFGLVDKAGLPAGSLSHGEKQWLEMAMLVAGDARLILLDEPTAGMTVEETEATARLIKTIQSERSLTVLVIEHDMDFVRELACPVIVMIRGAILCEGSYAQIQRNPEVREAYLGEVTTC